jgi:nucleoid-associated protein YgaU
MTATATAIAAEPRFARRPNPRPARPLPGAARGGRPPTPAPAVAAPAVGPSAASPAVGPVSAAVIRRRRLLALALLVAVAASVVLLAAHVGHADAELQGPPPAAPVYVVQRGDTLWTIAAEVAPGADTRTVVEKLSDAAGGSSLTPGQRIELPASLRT